MTPAQATAAALFIRRELMRDHAMTLSIMANAAHGTSEVINKLMKRWSPDEDD